VTVYEFLDGTIVIRYGPHEARFAPHGSSEAPTYVPKIPRPLGMGGKLHEWKRRPRTWGSASRPPGFIALTWDGKARAGTYPLVPAHGLAPRSAPGSHPCVALSSAAVRPRIRQRTNRPDHVLIKADRLTCYQQNPKWPWSKWRWKPRTFAGRPPVNLAVLRLCVHGTSTK
jgi:hypothetical protein